MKKILSLIIGAVLLFGFNSFAMAQVRVSATGENIEIVPGGTVTGTITVDNPTSEEISLKAYMEDLQYVAPFDGTVKTQPVGSLPTSLGRFTTLEPAVFSLPPNGSKKVTYIINAPKDAKGGYYGVALFEQTTPVEGQGVTVGIVVRIGGKLLAESKDRTVKAEIENARATAAGLEGTFVNTGNVIIFSDPAYSVIDDKGAVLDRGVITKQLTLPPGEKKDFKIDFAKKIPEGSYTLLIDFNRNRAGVLSKEIDFTKDAAGVIKVAKVNN